jgi:hypothetical protein
VTSERVEKKQVALPSFEFRRIRNDRSTPAATGSALNERTIDAPRGKILGAAVQGHHTALPHERVRRQLAEQLMQGF